MMIKGCGGARGVMVIIDQDNTLYKEIYINI